MFKHAAEPFPCIASSGATLTSCHSVVCDRAANQILASFPDVSESFCMFGFAIEVLELWVFLQGRGSLFTNSF